MERKNLPIILMLTASAVTCVITLIRNDSMLKMLTALLIAMIVFYALGTVMKWMLDEFDRRNEIDRIVPEEEILEEEEEEAEEE